MTLALDWLKLGVFTHGLKCRVGPQVYFIDKQKVRGTGALIRSWKLPRVGQCVHEVMHLLSFLNISIYSLSESQRCHFKRIKRDGKMFHSR